MPDSASDDTVRRLVRELLIELGVHAKPGGQITLHMDASGLVKQVQTTTYRKL